MGDLSFRATALVSTGDIEDQKTAGPNLYSFLNDSPANYFDALGLAPITVQGTITGDPVVHMGTRHQNYMTYTATCPDLFQVSDVSLNYDSVATAIVAMIQFDRAPQAQLDSFWRTYGPPNSGNLGGLKAINGANCSGAPFEIEAFMRTRYSTVYFGAYGGLGVQ